MTKLSTFHTNSVSVSVNIKQLEYSQNSHSPICKIGLSCKIGPVHFYSFFGPFLHSCKVGPVKMDITRKFPSLRHLSSTQCYFHVYHQRANCTKRCHGKISSIGMRDQLHFFTQSFVSTMLLPHYSTISTHSIFSGKTVCS